MYEKVESCPSCGNGEFENFLICKDHSVSGESFAIVRCTKCALYLTKPRPSKQNIGNYYKSANYISHTNKANNLVNSIYKIARKIALKQKLNLLHSYTNPRKVLDFGCGTGHFIKRLSNNGIHAEGVETDAEVASYAGEFTGLPVFQKLEEASDNYDVITAWHVLEHVHDLKTTIKTLKKKIKKEGYLFVAVPNINSYDSQYYREFWAGLDVPRHLYHFTQHSFSVLAKKSKLEIVNVHPMKMDAYNVSLLSEKYMNKKSSLWKAFKIGRKSNQKAQSTGEFSSLIYVLKK